MRHVDFDQYGELPDIAIIPVKIEDFEVAVPAPEMLKHESFYV